jgi:hypothetical protein
MCRTAILHNNHPQHFISLQYIYWWVEPPYCITTNPQQFISLQYIYCCVEPPYCITTNPQHFISLQYLYWWLEPPYCITTNPQQFISLQYIYWCVQPPYCITTNPYLYQLHSCLYIDTKGSMNVTVRGMRGKESSTEILIVRWFTVHIVLEWLYVYFSKDLETVQSVVDLYCIVLLCTNALLILL